MIGRKCEYAERCKLYSETAVTCNYEPGEYCGAFREHKANATQYEGGQLMSEDQVTINVEPGQAVIHVELENLFVLPDPKPVQPVNGTIYVSTRHAGKRVKAVIFEEMV